MPGLFSDPAAPDRMLDDREFKRALRRATLATLTALGLPLLILLTLVGLLYRTALWVDHTNQAIADATRADRLLVTMQTSFRGYRLSNNPRFFAPYAEARTQLLVQLDELKQAVLDNPAQASAITAFRADVEIWLAFVDDELAKIRAGETRIGDPAFMLQGAPLFERAQRQLSGFIGEEERLLSARKKRLNSAAASILIAFGVAAFLGLPVLALWLRRLLRNLASSYRLSLAATELRAKELQVTLNSIGDAVVATDARGRVSFLNPAAEELMGWSSAEARGRELAEVFHIFNETTRARVENPVARVLRENSVVGLANHTVLRSKSGAEHPIEDSAAPIRNERGEVAGVILVFHDVSERREAERALAASERQFRFLDELNEATRLLLEPAQIMAVSARLLGTQLRASRCAYAEVERDGEQFAILHDHTDRCASTVGRYQLSLFGPRAAEDMKAGRMLVVKNVDAELTPERGATMFNAIGIKAIICLPLVKERRLRAMMAVHQLEPREWTGEEIALVKEVVERCWATIERARAETERRAAVARAETLAQGVAEAAERFRLLAEVVSLQVWTAGVDGQLDFANHECAQYFGVDPERELLGRGWARYVHAEDLPGALAKWSESLASGQRYEVEFRLLGKDGAHRWFLVRAQAMRDADGRIVRWFGTNTDIDDMKRAQSAAERASRAKDDFIAALSHELRTPLTPVLLSAAALRGDERLPAEIRDQLEMMERNIALEARLIDDLLDLTSISRGKLNLRRQRCEAHALIGLAIEIVRDDARGKEIVIERDFAATLTGLDADPARFQQVIWNLLRNAVKFTPPGGRVSLRTSDRADAAGGAGAGARAPGLRIEVSDSGVGIEPAALEKIFQPFEQAAHAGNHRLGGLGLGLAIVRAIVEAHGGAVAAHSAGVGQGATFVVDFPAEPKPAEGADAGANASSATGAASAEEVSVSAAAGSALSAAGGADESARAVKPLRLLVVEDHAATLHVLGRLLTRDGHRVIAATCVAEALTAAAANAFDLVVSDLGLPDGTGIELMATLRDAHGLRGVALTGYGMDNDIEQSRAAGFVAHLTKPVDYAQLRRIIAALP